MRARTLYAIPVVVALFFACSSKANAQYFTYGFYSIVDNTGTTLADSTGAGFNVSGCSYVLSGTAYLVVCSYSDMTTHLTYQALPLETANIGGRGCPDPPPPPF